ncbi:chromosome partitioning protein ParA [Haemophilus paracuniculus]|uniref:Chromosome partitioning protein ParA n=1 Tax=Haemophilus paracuniculus TaxID=734 RepID=A0A1T0AVD1_9PAST|nr:ParA family protein [Haemophilus paracuniculus]OOS00844.1 chromosome partitioning protein ParA [Haemophilus paracuniculus]
MQVTSQKPFIVTVMSTKGGVTKSTNVANIGAFCADHGIHTLMIDTDTQPTLSSYYHLKHQSPYGIYELFARPDLPIEQLISQTEFEHLDIIQSNDPLDRLTTDLNSLPGGVLKFNGLIKKIQGYDLIIIDTRGTRGITVDMAVLASDLVISPIKPELVSAREFVRGTLNLYENLNIFTQYGIALPPLKAVINCLDRTKDAHEVVQTLYNIFADLDNEHIDLLNFEIPDRVAYREAASRALPVHRHSEKEAENIRLLCSMLFPQWADKFQG